MNTFYIVCYILIGLLFIAMIRKIILNHKINILNDRSNKIFHALSVTMLTNCIENEFGLKIGQMFKRKYTDEDNLGYKMFNMDITLVAKNESIDNDGTKALIMKRLYLIPTDIFMNQYIIPKLEINEENLIKKDSLYLQYSEIFHTVELWCGKYKLEEWNGADSIKVVSDINKILNYIFKEFQMKKQSITPLVGDFNTYYSILRGE